MTDHDMRQARRRQDRRDAAERRTVRQGGTSRKQARR